MGRARCVPLLVQRCSLTWHVSLQRIHGPIGDIVPRDAAFFDYSSGDRDCLGSAKLPHSVAQIGFDHLDRDAAVRAWFCEEVLPLEGALLRFIRRNWPTADDATDLMHDVYELAITGARTAIPQNTPGYLFTVARNHLINRAKRARIVSFDLVADLEAVAAGIDMFEAERQLHARDALRRVQAGMEKLSPRVREIVLLRKVEGLDVAETSQRLGIGKDAVNHQLAMGMKALADHMLGGAGKIVRRRYTARRTGRGEA